MSSKRFSTCLIFAAWLSGAVFWGAPAMGQSAAWQARPEPMGASARELVARAEKDFSAKEASALLVQIQQLPPNQCAAALEACLRRPRVSPTVKDAVLECLAGEGQVPISRRLADAVLLFEPREGWGRSQAWQKALRRFHNDEVVAVLASWARDPSVSFGKRAAVFGALGGMPSCASLETLLVVHDSQRKEDKVFMGAVNGALREMFCLTAEPTPEQLAAWRKLCNRHDQMAFNLYLKDRLEATVRASQVEIARYVSRIADQEEALFIRETPEAQQAHLEKMLGDMELAEVRLRALELLDSQVALGLPVSEKVRAAVRACLTYPNSRVRSKSAHLLSTLGDGAGARKVAGLLADKAEEDSDVLSAMMRLMKREPQDRALPAVRQLLEHPDASVAAVATEALTAYGEKQKLNDAMRQDVAQVLLLQLKAKEAAPSVAQILLLGQVLDIENQAGWDRVSAWLADAKQPETVREAAALAWEKSTQPLAPLLVYVAGTDAKLSEIAMRAVRDRGFSPADIAPLLGHKPETEVQKDLRSAALLGWAGRALPEDVGQAVAQVIKDGAPANLAVQMIGKVLGRAQPLADAQRMALLVQRAQIQERAETLAGAIEDYDAALALAPAEAKPGLLAKCLQLRLGQKKTADAAAFWTQLAAQETNPDWLAPSLKVVLSAIDKDADTVASAPNLLKQMKQALAKAPAQSLFPLIDALLVKYTPVPVVPPAKVPPIQTPEHTPVEGSGGGPAKPSVKDPATDRVKEAPRDKAVPSGGVSAVPAAPPTQGP